MTRPIKETHILFGEDARRFEARTHDAQHKWCILLFTALALMMCVALPSCQKKEVPNAATSPAADAASTVNENQQKGTENEVKFYQPKMYDYRELESNINADNIMDIMRAIDEYDEGCRRKTSDIADNAENYIEYNNSESAINLTKQALVKELEEYNNNISNSSNGEDNSCVIVLYIYYINTLRLGGRYKDALDASDEAYAISINKWGVVDFNLILNRAMVLKFLGEHGYDYEEHDDMYSFGPHPEFGEIKTDEDKELFKKKCNEAALNDYNYISSQLYNPNVTYSVALLNRSVGNYQDSLEAIRIMNQHGIVDANLSGLEIKNYASLGDADVVKSRSEMAMSMFPDDKDLLNDISEAYSILGMEEEAGKLKLRAKCQYYIPQFIGLDCESNDTYDLFNYFAGDTDPKEKIDKLETIQKTSSQDYTISVALMILRMHANHGNGVEEKAEEILKKIGKPAINKVNNLFTNNISTCTVSAAARIMASVKDPSSWDLLVDYLPTMATEGMLLIQSEVPSVMMTFDRKKARVLILKVLGNFLAQDGDFRLGEYYYALKDEKIEDLKKIAFKEAGFTDKTWNEFEKTFKRGLEILKESEMDN